MKNIIITGTSRGIGHELALLFAKNNYNVLALSRNISESFNQFQNIKNLSIDLSNENDLKQVSEFITKNWSQVDAVVHNAGALLLKPFAQTSNDDFLDIYKVNVFGVANLTRIVLPFLKKGSHVVSISSMGGIQGSSKFAGLAAYSSSKGAVITLSELLAEEFAAQGIAFNVLALGAVNTEMLAEAFPGYVAPVSALEMAQYIFDFTLTGNKFYNGKVLQVSASTP
jgi:NAD(P)-dependent dehydrogenase (short-subunit alcohol dehydrogenase family)